MVAKKSSVKKARTSLISKTTGRPIDPKRSRAAVKAAKTRKLHAASLVETRQSLRLHHKIISGGAILAVLVLAFVGIRSQLESYAATTTRDATKFPFSSDSPWNTAIGSGATFASSSDKTTTAIQKHSASINSDQWSVAIWQAKSSDPTVTISGLKAGSNTLSTIKIPTSATTTGPAKTSTVTPDHWMSVIQPNKETVQEFGGNTTKLSSTKWQAGHAAITDLFGEGINGGVRASKTSQISGVIRSADLSQNKIAHALSIQLNGDQLKSGYQWPAYAQDIDASTSYTGVIPMGSLYAIPKSVDVTKLGLSSDGLILAHALQNYGGYVAARSSNVTLLAELSASSSRVGSMSTAFNNTLRNQLRRVTNSSSTHVGGGGTPRVAALPPVD